VDRLAQGVIAPQSGAFTTNIPIDLPSMRRVTPHLGLAYNSSAPNGFAGVGWQLSGFSTIERTTSRHGAPRFNASPDRDTYTLDGEPLIASGALGGTHATLRQTFLRISQGNPDWRVTEPNGTVSTYRPLFKTPAGTLKWGIASTVDTHGDTVNYRWACDSDTSTFNKDYDCYPAAISYANVTVDLARELRPDVETFGTGYGIGQSRYRLKSISVNIGGALKTRYAVSYRLSSRTGRSLIANVVQTGTDGVTALPATTFNYQDTSLAWSNASDIGNLYGLTPAIWRSSQVFPADFNGDGRSDLLLHYRYGTNAAAYLLLANASGGFDYATDITTAGGLTPQNWWYGSVTVGDVTGDGKADLFLRYAVNRSLAKGYLLPFNGTGFAAAQDVSAATGLGDVTWYSSSITPIESNGDGRVDLLVRSRDGVNATTYIVQGIASGFAPATNITNLYGANQTTWYNSSVVIPGDFNGDGLTDLLLENTFNGAMKGLMLRSSSEGGFENIADVSAPTGLSTADWQCGIPVAGDYNGDGRTDLILQRGSCATGPTYLLRATAAGSDSGQNAFDRPMDISNASGMTQKLWQYADATTGDFNGDGKTDLILKSWQESIPDPHLLLLSGAAGFINAQNMTTAYGMTNNAWQFSNPRAADLDGDGDDDILVAPLASAYATPALRLDVASTASDVLSSMGNGYGGTTAISYRPSSAWANTGAPPISQTVQRMVAADGLGWSATTQYEYQGGAWDFSERRNLGFRYVKEIAPTGAFQESYFFQGAPYPLGALETRVLKNAAGGVMTRRDTQLTGSTDAPWIRLPTQLDTYECNGDTGCKATRVSAAFDGYGNRLTQTEYGDVTTSGDERTTQTTYYPNGYAYAANYVARKAIYEGVTTQGRLLAEEKTYFDGAQTETAVPSKGDPTATLIWTGTKYLRTDRTFDGFGNPLSVRSPLGYTTQYAWDTPSSLYMTRETNAAAHAVVTGWNLLCGQKASQKDPNQAETTWQYDALCRKARQTNPDAGYIRWSYVSFGSPGQQYVEEASWDGTADDLWKRTYFDGLGRAYETVSDGDRTTLTSYNSLGLVDSVSAPLSSNESPQRNYYTYDAARRLTRIRHPDNSTQQFLYDDWLVTACDELGKPTTSFTDAYGRVSVVREYLNKGCSTQPSGTAGVDQFDTRTVWDLLDQKVEVRDAKNRKWSYAFDAAGRPVASQDPDLGAWNYSYDDDGRLASQTDAKNVTLTFKYDQIGRMIEKAQGATGVLATYWYDEAGQGASIGHMTRQAFSLGFVEYDYDGMGRLAEERQYHVPPHVEAPREVPPGSPDPGTEEPQPQPCTCVPPGNRAPFGSLVATWATSKVGPKPTPPGRCLCRPHPGLPTPTTLLAYDPAGGDGAVASGDEAATVQSVTTLTPDFRLRWTYDQAGRVASMTYPDNEVVTYGYDAGGRLYRLGEYVTAATYDARDRVLSRQLGNGVLETFSYSPTRFWPLGYAASINGVRIHNVTVDRNARNEVTSRANPLVAGDQWTYQYDDLRRLRVATSTGNPAWSESYDFDESGRMTYQSKMGAYTYVDRTTAVHAPAAIGSSALQYDANGRMTSGPNLAVAYDGEGQVSSVNDDFYFYDGHGERVRVAERTGAGTRFIGDYAERQYSPSGTVTNVNYYYFGTYRVAARANTAIRYYHGDHLGSATTVTDGSGTVVARKVFAPFGATLYESATIADPFGLGGQRRESSGLYDMKARKQAPNLSMFVAPDPSDEPDSVRPQSLNRYSYADNSPTNLIDPTGFASVDPATAATAGNQLTVTSVVDGGVAAMPGTSAGGESSHLAPAGGRSPNALTLAQLEVLQDEFDVLSPRLRAIRGQTPIAVADQFGSTALPFTEKWGFEVGANIMGAGSRFWIDDVTLGYFGGVTIPENTAAVADVHTHPASSGAKFSGAVGYSKEHGFVNCCGDLSTDYKRNIDGYVYRAGGGAWHFNQRAFRRDFEGSLRTRTEIDARWSRYVEPIR
jgi:RHS repeat-associated protein